MNNVAINTVNTINTINTINTWNTMAYEHKAISRSESDQYVKDGWEVSREIDKDRVVVSRAGAGKPMRKAKCAFVDLHADGQMLALRTPYDPEFVEDLKTRIDWHDRKWDNELKVWLVARKAWQHAREALKKHYGEDAVTYTPVAETALIELLEDDIESPDLAAYMTLGVRSDAPEGVLHAAYLHIEACHAPLINSAPGYVHIVGDGIPDIDEARKAYVRILAHRKILPHQAAAEVVFTRSFPKLPST